MLVYDKGYNAIRNKYILPLSNYSIRYQSLGKNNIKSLFFSNELLSVSKISKNEYHFYFREDALMKALLGDIQLMYIRMSMQEQDFDSVSGAFKDITANWNIVTAYYHGFFAASLLLRLCFRGNIFLEASQKNELERIISELIGERISLESNLFYEIFHQDDGYYVKLKHCDANTHKVVWEKINVLLQEEIILLANKNSDEEELIKKILDINRDFSPQYPSQLRNRVNYQLLYGKKYLDDELFHINRNINWAYTLSQYDDVMKEQNDQNACNLFYAYDKYIETFAKKLLYDYYAMRGTGQEIVKKMNSKMHTAIELRELPFLYEK